MAFFAGGGIVASGGCAGPVPGGPVPLADVAALVVVDGEDDPFAGEGGPPVACPEGSVKVGDFGGETAFDVSTDGCPRVTAAAPLLVDVAAGDRIVVRAWRTQLYAGGEEGVTAVLALAIGGEEVWREEIPIPQPTGAAVLADVPAPRDWTVGAPVAWHVHNHGKNSYHLLELSLRPLVPASEARP